ncbi:MAG: hydrogenase expression/formation protein HypE [Polyangiaceae bacterium]
MNDERDEAPALPECPVPQASEVITMAHGGGGRAMGRLLDDVILRHLRSLELDERGDSAVLDLGGALRSVAPARGAGALRDAGPRVAFTTDSYVVSPRFFPGGDIGALAVFGTVNDLAMAGAEPVALSVSLLLEEGFALAELSRVAASIQAACDAAGVRVVTGDTKVVDRGKGDGLYITTSGIGVVRPGVRVAADRIEPGDAVLLSGDLGRHGMAILGAREHLGFEPAIESDCAPLNGPMTALLDARVDVHAARDLTRGGLAAALCELSGKRGARVVIEEERVLVSPEVSAACEILGLDPLHVACEGRMVLFVPGAKAERACEVLREFEVSAAARSIGLVERVDEVGGLVEMRTRLGGRRVLDLPSGAELPRIC